MKEIKFYKVNDDYGFMSNFAPYPFSDGSRIWPTSEHYFQAQKFLVPQIQEKIRQIVSPMDAALEGRNRQNPLRPDWEEVKDEVMLQALRMKFSQNPEIAKIQKSRKNCSRQEMPSSSNIHEMTTTGLMGEMALERTS